MMPLRRAAPPGFWADAEKKWLARVDAAEIGERKLPLDPLRWTREKKALALHFLASVRTDGGPQLCAYCDGTLGETSPATIDHFFPQDPFRRLVLC